MGVYTIAAHYQHANPFRLNNPEGGESIRRSMHMEGTEKIYSKVTSDAE